MGPGGPLAAPTANPRAAPPQRRLTSPAPPRPNAAIAISRDASPAGERRHEGREAIWPARWGQTRRESGLAPRSRHSMTPGRADKRAYVKPSHHPGRIRRGPPPERPDRPMSGRSVSGPSLGLTGAAAPTREPDPPGVLPCTRRRRAHRPRAPRWLSGRVATTPSTSDDRSTRRPFFANLTTSLASPEVSSPSGSPSPPSTSTHSSDCPPCR